MFSVYLYHLTLGSDINGNNNNLYPIELFCVLGIRSDIGLAMSNGKQISEGIFLGLCHL